MRLVFQGDSVTDWYRKYEDLHDLGQGYAHFVAPLLDEYYPENNWEFINKGVSGDRTCNLLERWQEDCIKLQPDYLSILVGINDTWRAFDSNDPTTVDQFEANYRKLLEDVKAHTKAKILMLEPFLLPTDPEKAVYRADLDPKIQVVRHLAMEYADAFVPLDGLFAAACLKHEPAYWSEDGVHPTQEGARLLAEHYCDAFVELLG